MKFKVKFWYRGKYFTEREFDTKDDRDDFVFKNIDGDYAVEYPDGKNSLEILKIPG